MISLTPYFHERKIMRESTLMVKSNQTKEMATRQTMFFYNFSKCRESRRKLTLRLRMINVGPFSRGLLVCVNNRQHISTSRRTFSPSFLAQT